MTRDMMHKLEMQIPVVVEEMRSWSLGEPMRQMISETVYEISQSGVVYSKSEFVIDETDLLDHIRRAKRMGLEIEASETQVTVTRTLSDGRRYKAVYIPITEGGEEVYNK